MHTSGISCSQELVDQFRAANTDPDIGFMRIEIEDESFVKKGEGKTGSSMEENFKIISKELQPKVPCYLLTKGKNPYML